MRSLSESCGERQDSLPETSALRSRLCAAILQPERIINNMAEFEQWLFEFKRLYREYGGPPSLTYATLRWLLEQWNAQVSPAAAVDLARPGGG